MKNNKGLLLADVLVASGLLLLGLLAFFEAVKAASHTQEKAAHIRQDTQDINEKLLQNK